MSVNEHRPSRTILLVALLTGLAALGCIVFVSGWLANILGIPSAIPVSTESLVGTYVVRYGIADRPAGQDTLVLRRDHAFEQTCVLENGHTVRASGTWGMEPGRGAKHIWLSGALAPVEPSDHSGPRKKAIRWYLGTERHLTGIALVVDDDNDIRFWKTK